MTLLPVDAGRAESGEPRADQAADQRVRRTDRQRPPPGEDLPDYGPEQGRDDQVGGGVAGVDDPADGLGDRHAHDERADEVEDGREADGDLGFERPGVDDGGDGVAAVVEAVHQVEDESDRHDRDQSMMAVAHDFTSSFSQ